MNILFIISTDDAETAYNAMRLANVAVKKDDDEVCHHRSKNQPKSSFATQPERSKGAPMRLVLF